MTASPKVSQWLRRFDLLTLRLFVSIVEEGSIGRAAARESMAPSAATKRLGALEEGLGFPLFIRNARGTVPTPVGQMAAQHARDILDSIDQLGRKLDELSAKGSGSIRVSSTPTTLVQFLAEDVAGFTRSFPQIRFDLQSSFTPDVIKAVECGDADVAVCSLPPDPIAGLDSTPYCSERMVAVMSHGHPLSRQRSVSLGDLLQTDMIGWTPEGAMMNDLRRHATEAGLEFRPKLRVSSMDAARALVRSGLGVVLLPEGAVGSAEEADRLCARTLDEPWADRKLCILTPSGGRMAPSARAFVDYLASSGRKQSLQMARHSRMAVANDLNIALSVQ